MVLETAEAFGLLVGWRDFGVCSLILGDLFGFVSF